MRTHSSSGGEREAMTVLEVLKPASQGPIQVGDDGLQALSVVTPGLGSNRVFELVQALLARPTLARFEVVTQKVKAVVLIARAFPDWLPGSARYGKRGQGFIEAHHRRPIGELNRATTAKLKDLVMVCSNCHRMLHRPPWITLEALRSLVQRSE